MDAEQSKTKRKDEEMKTHELKTEPPYFQAVLDGRKRFEVRKNDRGFEEGDKLLLKEYDADVHVFTGRRIEVTVTYITDYEQQPGYVVLGIAPTMTEQELKEIRNDLSFITEGRWFRYNDETRWIGVWDEENQCDTPVCECHELEDAMFIEKAPEYVRRLLTEVERLQKENEMLRQSSGSEIASWLGRQTKKFIRDVDKFDRDFEEAEKRMEEQHKEMEEEHKKFKKRWKMFER